MRRVLTTILILASGLLSTACDGNVGDIFSAFPVTAFTPEAPGGVPPGGIPGGFRPIEVGFLGSSQGVTGTVRNIATASVSGRSIAFLSAESDGVHLVDVSLPGRITPAAYITTIHDSVLSDAAATIAGGRVDDVAVIDNTYLVCLAVGSGAPNAVTVFHIPTLLERATSAGADLSDAYVPGIGDIVANGTSSGNGGQVAGGNNIFLVASGGPTMGMGFITAGTPGTWAALPPVPAATPPIDNFLTVVFATPAAYAVVAQGDDLSVATISLAIAVPPSVTLEPSRLPLTGSFAALDAKAAAVPGAFPTAMAINITRTIYVAGLNDVRIFNATAPSSPTESNTIFSAGLEISGMVADATLFALANNSTITFRTSVLGGRLTEVGSYSAAGRRNFDMALASDREGRYVLSCAGGLGLRIIRWSDIPQ